MNIPNILSLLRLVLVPCFAVIYMSSMKNAGIYAGIVFLAAALTDVVDGYLARRWQQITKFGRILDPLADKLLQLTALACLMLKGVVPWPLCAIFLGKELLMILGGMFMVNRLDDVIPSNLYGKVVSFLISATICAAIFFHEAAGKVVPNLFPALFAVETVLALIALVIYFIRHIRCLKKKKIVLDDRSGRLKNERT